jgi:hypothetical protein
MLCLLTVGVGGCGRISDILDVAPPAGLSTADGLDNRSGTESRYLSARAEFFSAMVGSQRLIETSGRMSDEFVDGQLVGGGSMPSVDARSTRFIPAFGEPTDRNLSMLSGARSLFMLVAPKLHQYEPADGQSKAGEAYALAGYAEVMLAEDYCAGVTLDRVLPDGGWEYNMPLTTDSLFAVAEAHFDTALAYASGDADVIALANSGLARARIGRGHLADAATAAANVPTEFVYNIETSPERGNGNNLYVGTQYCSGFNIGDREGGNGLNFLSANDPRLVTDSTITMTCDQRRGYVSHAPFFYPVKFGNPSTLIPLASGIQARLVEAEAALADNDVSWLTTLNALRTTCTTTVGCPTPAPAGSGGVEGLPPLDDPGNTTSRIDLLFRERAFWLFGTGTRLGDLRRLVRQYGRAANTVFPTGVYGGGLIASLPVYGTDVSFTLPTPGSGTTVTNPYYKGCLTSPSDS